MKATATNERIHPTDEPVQLPEAGVRDAYDPEPFGPHHPYGPKNLVGGPRELRYPHHPHPADGLRPPHGPHHPHLAHEPIPFDPPAPHGLRPPHEPHLIESPHGHHPVPRPRRARVSFDEEELAAALDRLGAKFLVDEVQAAPAEVKLALSLALRAPVRFMPADRGGAEEGWGNPLLDDDHLACLEDAFLVDRDRIKLELQGAPLHMTALVLALAGYGDRSDCAVNVFGDPVPFRLDDKDDAPDPFDVDAEGDDGDPEESLLVRLADAIAGILGVADDEDDEDDLDFDLPFRRERDHTCNADTDAAAAAANDREKGAR